MLLINSTMMKILVAFLAASLPKIFNIYLYRRKRNNLEEKVLEIVQEYTMIDFPSIRDNSRTFGFALT